MTKTDATDPTDATAATDPAVAPAGLPRRTVLRGAVLAGAAVPFLAACGSDGSDDAGSTEPAAEEETTAAAGGGEPIATTADVPEGGGVIFEDAGIVITQPAAGEFKGFTNICMHQGCPVDNVTDGTINCLCHGSKYSIEDGSVVDGPAPEALTEKAITVTGEDITLA